MTLSLLRRLHKLLCERADGSITTMPDGHQWIEVCIDNINIDGLTPHQKAGYLSQLQRLGVYRHSSDGFGLVCCTKTINEL